MTQNKFENLVFYDYKRNISICVLKDSSTKDNETEDIILFFNFNIVWNA